MNIPALNIILNLLGVLLGGGALVGVLRYLNNRQGLRNADEADIRDHYAEEITGLRADRAASDARFNAAQSAADRRLAECEEAGAWHRDESAKLRLELADVRAEIEGLKRQIIRYSAESVIALTSEPPASEQVAEAAHRVIKEIKQAEGGD